MTLKQMISFRISASMDAFSANVGKQRDKFKKDKKRYISLFSKKELNMSGST